MLARTIALGVALALAGCGGEGQGGVVPAGAFDRPKPDDGVEKLDAIKRAAAAEDERRAAAAEAELQALVDEVAIVPDEKPKTLVAACKAVAAGMDALIQRQFANDKNGLAQWNLDKTATLRELEDRCHDEDTIDTAACKAHAMQHADDRLVGDAFGLMDRCDAKFGKPKVDGKAVEKGKSPP